MHRVDVDLLLDIGDWEQAASAFERAFAAAPGTIRGRLCAAKALFLRSRPREAERQLRALIDGDPTVAEAHLLLGHILSEADRFDEATTSFEQAIALDPSCAPAYHGLVSSRTMTKADRPLLVRMASRLDRGDLPERQRMTLHFALGKALDDLKEYAEAATHYDAANRIRRKLSPFDARDFAKQIDGLVGSFTREFLRANAALGDDDETPVLVLGMPRSGTTLVERILSSHPAVAGGGELRFWRDARARLASAPTSRLGQVAAGVRGAYLRLLRTIGPDARRVTDKMPFNFLWVGLVHLLLPRARVVHCRRHPIDTCLSIYQTQFAESWGFASDFADLASYYRQYRRLMDHWRAVLPADRMLDVDYEDVVASPDVTSRRLVAFCGLPWDAACLHPERNPDAIRTASRWQARQPIYRTSVERWRRYEPWIGALPRLLGLPTV
jgi:tetratricopeptide (TPR) repeat protein